MKRLIALIIAVVCMIPAAVLASGTDLASLSFDELLELRAALESEIVSRPEWKEVTVPSGSWIVGKDIPAREYSIHPTSRGGYFRIRRNGKVLISQGIRSEEAAFGKIQLVDGDVVEIEDGSLIFAPPVGLGF